MNDSLSPKDRSTQIELVRARAALERQTMARSAKELGASLEPKVLMRSFMPKMPSRSTTDWMLKGVSLARRYPLVASGMSAILTRAAKRKKWLRIGAGLLITWQIARTFSRKS